MIGMNSNLRGAAPEKSNVAEQVKGVCFPAKGELLNEELGSVN